VCIFVLDVAQSLQGQSADLEVGVAHVLVQTVQTHQSLVTVVSALLRHLLLQHLLDHNVVFLEDVYHFREHDAHVVACGHQRDHFSQNSH